MASWLGLDPNCYTGGDCWNYDYSDRGLLILAICAGIALIVSLANKYLK
jgi:hypothetical protein